MRAKKTNIMDIIENLEYLPGVPQKKAWLAFLTLKRSFFAF